MVKFVYYVCLTKVFATSHTCTKTDHEYFQDHTDGETHKSLHKYA